jgi:hypothetical protein
MTVSTDWTVSKSESEDEENIIFDDKKEASIYDYLRYSNPDEERATSEISDFDDSKLIS